MRGNNDDGIKVKLLIMPSPGNIGQGSSCTATQDNQASAFTANALTTIFLLTMSRFGVPDHEPRAPIPSSAPVVIMTMFLSYENLIVLVMMKSASTEKD